MREVYRDFLDRASRAPMAGGISALAQVLRGAGTGATVSDRPVTRRRPGPLRASTGGLP
jgi:hypothetical protein